jgi:hypothetical protein
MGARGEAPYSGNSIELKPLIRHADVHLKGGRVLLQLVGTYAGNDELRTKYYRKLDSSNYASCSRLGHGGPADVGSSLGSITNPPIQYIVIVVE